MSENYAYYLYVRDLPALTETVSREEAQLRRTHPLLADRLVKAFAVLIDELRVLSATVAGAGTLRLKEEEKATRVRPDTEGLGGPRLESSLKSDQIPALPGSVGIADEDLLNKEVPWWSTNEEGSTARIGGVLFGLFYSSDFTGGAQPNRAEFRVHPLFQAGDMSGEAGAGVIKKPIPPRRFVQKSIPEVEALWLAGFEKAKKKFNEELAYITSQIGRELQAAPA